MGSTADSQQMVAPDNDEAPLAPMTPLTKPGFLKTLGRVPLITESKSCQKCGKNARYYNYVYPCSPNDYRCKRCFYYNI